jgi:hypothetical protein
LTNDDFNVLVVHAHALEAVHFLNFVHEEFLNFFGAPHPQDIVRVHRTVRQGFAHAHPVAFVHHQVFALGNIVIPRQARVFVRHRHFHGAAGRLAQFHHAVDFRRHRGGTRFARFKEFRHAGKTPGDVFALGNFLRNLGQHIPG